MSEEPKKQNLFMEILTDVGTNIRKDAKKQAVSFTYNAFMTAVDIVQGSLKDSITRGFYKDGKAPNRRGYTDYTATSRGNNTSVYARDYGAVSQNNYQSGGEAVTDVRAIFRPTKLEADNKLNWIIEKIDNSSDNCCTVGALYESEEPKLPTTMMSWKYGWSEKDVQLMDSKMVTSGPHSGEWILVLPKPHRVL